MSKMNLDSLVRGCIELHISDNVAVFKQYGMWYDVQQRYQFVPTLSRGFVVATSPQKLLIGKPLASWAISKPRALMLEWADENRVELRTIELELALSWFNADGHRWRHKELK